MVTSLLHWLATPEQAGLRRAFTVWFNRVLRASQPGNAVEPGFEELAEVKTMLAETVKEWHRQWKKEGLEEGHKEGQVNLLLKQLELKFGPLSDDLRSRVHAADGETLSIWAERILTAQTLEDVL